MTKKRKYSGKVEIPQSAFYTKSNIVLFLAFIFLVLLGIGTLVFFQKKLNEGSKIVGIDITPTPYLPTLERMKNAIDIDIKVEKDGITPDKITLDKDTDYNFRIIRFPGSTCDSLRNELLDYNLDLINTAVSYPIRIPTAGEYKLKCIGQDSELILNVK